MRVSVVIPILQMEGLRLRNSDLPITPPGMFMARVIIQTGDVLILLSVPLSLHIPLSWEISSDHFDLHIHSHFTTACQVFFSRFLFCCFSNF